jgi:acetolactate decarboxylase
VTLDAPLVAAVTLRREPTGTAGDCSASDAVHQLQLAHVLLDGGYDGVATLADALATGDHGLGTVDRLDGELVVVDGEPWRVDWLGHADLLDPSTRTPFVIVSTLESPTTVRLQDASRDQVAAAIEDLVPDPGAVVSVRLEGAFTSVLVRSVPPQDPPYRPYSEVCRTDEVRWEHRPFYGVFVGFRFPDISPVDGATIPGLHLHGLDRLRSTGGHNLDLQVKDAVLSVGVSHDISVQLPDPSMVDLLLTPPDVRAVQRLLLRMGPRTIGEVAAALAISPPDATRRLEWLADRGFVSELPSGIGGLGGEPRWRMTLRAHGRRPSASASRLLEAL